MNFRLAEIFSSIEGEGRRAGQLATFVRLAGCNLRCSYCDTAYAQGFNGGKRIGLAAIIERVASFANPFITLTGGEPLAQPHVDILVDALLDCGQELNIETNGTISLDDYCGRTGLFVTMDWKTPASGCCEQMLGKNLELLRAKDVLKIVMAESDFAYVQSFLQNSRTAAQIYLSPIYGLLAPERLVEFAKKLARLPEIDAKKLHVQLQLHKVIWGAKARSV